MLNEALFEENMEDENSINPNKNDEPITKSKQNNKKWYKNNIFSIDKEKEASLKIRKEEKEEKEEKKNKKEEFHEVKDEKEYDQIAELEEKFKSLLMKVPGKEREDVLIYGVKVTYLKSKNKIKNGVVFCDDDTNLQFLCPDDPDNLILFDIKLASISDILLGRSNGYLKDIELPIDNNCCMTIKYNDGLKYVDLIFYSVEICEYFISGII